MKKCLVLLLGLFMVLGMALPVSANKGQVYEAPYGTPVIDGEMDAIWDNAPWTDCTILHRGGNPNNVSMRVKMMWDENSIYYFVEVVDPEIVDADAVEFYIDELMCFDMGYREDDRQTVVFPTNGSVISSNNAVSDVNGVDIGRPELGKGAATKMTGNGFVMEVGLNFSHIKGSVGKEIGIEFMYGDSDATGFIEALRWNVDTPGGDTPPYQSTEHFGKMRMIAAPVVEVPVEEVPAEVPGEEAAVTETPATKPVAPQTSDYGFISAGIAIIALASLIAVSKKRK